MSSTSRRIRWLEWMNADPRTTVGGAEIHLLSMAGRLEARGVEVRFSTDPEELFRGEGHDIIRTHGATLPPGYWRKAKTGAPRAVRIHTLHGSAIGQMLGLGEPFRLRHHKAWFREVSGVLKADVVASIHPGLALHRWSAGWGKTSALCWNGWDSSTEAPGASAPGNSDRWAFIGRLWDRVKGADRIMALLDAADAPKFVAVPGEGLPDHPSIARTGRLDSSGIHALLAASRGLVLPSRFEGLPLVVLEALASGIPVVATRVGGMEWIAKREPAGLRFIDEPDHPQTFADALRSAERDFPASEREARAHRNRAVLWTWEDCTRALVDAVNPLLEARTGLVIPSRAE